MARKKHKVNETEPRFSLSAHCCAALLVISNSLCHSERYEFINIQYNSMNVLKTNEQLMQCNSLWIKASIKYVNVNASDITGVVTL